MFNMSSQDTRRKVRLNEKVESRVRGDLYARFGGECLETCYCQRWQGAGCLAYGTVGNRQLPPLLPHHSFTPPFHRPLMDDCLTDGKIRAKSDLIE